VLVPLGNASMAEHSHIRDHNRGAIGFQLLACRPGVSGFHADGGPVFQEDFRDAALGENNATGRFNHRDHGFRNGLRSTFRVPSAMERVVDDTGMDAKATLGRRQAIIAPLGGQQGFEFGIAKVAVQIVLGGLAGDGTEGMDERPEEGMENGGKRVQQGMGIEPEGCLLDIDKLATDGDVFCGEELNQLRRIALGVAGNGNGEIWINKLVETVGEGAPAHLAMGEVVKEGPCGAAWRPLADVGEEGRDGHGRGAAEER
jgi:hypothetical protein